LIELTNVFAAAILHALIPIKNEKEEKTAIAQV